VNTGGDELSDMRLLVFRVSELEADKTELFTDGKRIMEEKVSKRAYKKVSKRAYKTVSKRAYKTVSKRAYKTVSKRATKVLGVVDDTVKAT